MAKIIGTSGAWKSVCVELNSAGIYPENPSQISNMLEFAKKEYATAKTNATQEIKNKIESLKTNVNQLETSFESDVKRCRAEISAEIESVQLALDMLQDGASFIQKIIIYSRVKKIKRKLSQLKSQHKNCPQLFQRKISLIQKTLNEMQRNSDSIIANKCRANENNVNLLQNALSSPDFAGALAELELIEKLRTLPDNYYVVSDVKLAARKSIHLDGKWLTSAQLDHVVVTSSGIFVIETKNWSKKFMEGSDYFDPYQQVKRASYLCSKLIGGKYNLKTRSIIAYKGSVPEKPSDSYAKVLAIDEVKSYIAWFKETNTSDRIIETVANWLAAQ
jgi:hypothetical protein